jgi:hypothetical protein
VKRLLLAALAASTLAFAAPALAADGTTTTGGTTIVDGVATLVSNTGTASTADDFSTVSLPLPAGLTLAQITQLSAEFNVTDDDCAAGSPRFAINYGTNMNVFVYLGPAPTFTGCAQNTWISSGNLVNTTDACRVDTAQIAPGTQCSTWAAAVALIGNQAINSISLVVDSGFTQADKEQTIQIRNVVLNDKTFLVPTTPKPAKVNPAKLCKAQIASMGSRSAFNELWSTNGTSNGYGKCVAAVAKAKNGNATQDSILAAIASCKARGLKGAALGSCVAARDGVAATRTEAQERPKKGKRN